MAGRPSLNARSLEALGAARLAESLVLHTEGNAAARRALRLALAEARGPQEMAQEARKRLASARRSPRRSTARLRPWRWSCPGACWSWPPPCWIASTTAMTPAALVEQVADAVLSNSHGQYDRPVRDLVGALMPEGLALLRQQQEHWRPAPCEPHLLLEEDEPEAGEGEGVLVPAAEPQHRHGGGHHAYAWDDDEADDGWIGSFEPDDDDGDDHLAMDPWQQRQDVRLALLAIADGLGDAEAYLAEHRTHAPRRPGPAAARGPAGPAARDRWPAGAGPGVAGGGGAAGGPGQRWRPPLAGCAAGSPRGPGAG